MFDITLIGAGVSNVFLAYTLLKENKELTIHMIDIGNELSNRTCGLDMGGDCDCEGICNKYVGFAGLGKSEGKFNYTNDFGGDLYKKIGREKTLKLMQEVDAILCSYGGHLVESYSTKNTELEKLAGKHHLQVLSTEVRHLGTRLAQKVFQEMYEELKEGVTFSFQTSVESIDTLERGFQLNTNNGEYTTKKLVIGTGMSGSKWFETQTQSLGLFPGETRLDLGIRVEMKGDQLHSILQNTFETKLKFIGEGFSATTYCMNPKGRIIRKHQHGLVMPDGQNAREEETPSANLNFTLFVPQYFSSYEKAAKYAQVVIGGINQDRDRIVVQRFEDFKLNRQTTSLEENEIIPTLHADCGDVKNEVPLLYTEALEGFLTSLEGLIQEPIHKDSLLYGIDAKFYEPKLQTNEEFETEVKNLFLVGDCSGETHSLSQAAASGIYLGKHLALSMKEKEE
ncbi:hypothetical protein [Rossellomorea aquimaris]|uniref:hypothetical protein n=1 Tax=Rossellomorea aquimaris TaxID=189382 RepID=UPI0007D09362|nr:hypothetical protein [Rossellomorea aquimaris]